MYFIWEGAEKVFPLRRIWEGFYWCRTYTPFEKELRRYFHLRRLNIFQHFDLRRHWEGFLFEKDLRSMELLQSSWDGFEKVRWIWEGNVPSQILCISHIKIKTTFRWQQDPIVDTSRFDQYVILTKFRKSEVAFFVNSVKWKTKIFTGVSAVIGVENRVIYYRVLSICRVVVWSVV